MHVYTCPKCYKVNPSTKFICKRCETSLVKLTEMKLTRDEAKTLQESLYRSHGHEVIEQLKAEYGAPEQYYLSGDDLDLTEKLPFRANYLWHNLIALFILILSITVILIVDGFDGEWLESFLKFGFPVVIASFSSVQLGRLPSNVQVMSDYLKIGSNEIRWHQIHRIGFYKSRITEKNRIVLEIWHGQNPEVIKLNLNENKKMLALRQILEAVSKEKTIPYYVHQEGWK